MNWEVEVTFRASSGDPNAMLKTEEDGPPIRVSQEEGRAFQAGGGLSIEGAGRERARLDAEKEGCWRSPERCQGVKD